AFLPAGEKQTVAPTKEIQTIYLEDYKLKNYIPTVMQMGHFSADNPNQQPVYYSLQYPTLISDIPNYKGYVSVADEIRELKELMDIFIELVLNNEIKLDNVALKNLFSKVRYDFFHTDMHT